MRHMKSPLCWLKNLLIFFELEKIYQGESVTIILYYKDTLEFSLIYKMIILFAIFSSLSVFSVRILSTNSAVDGNAPQGRAVGNGGILCRGVT